MKKSNQEGGDVVIFGCECLYLQRAINEREIEQKRKTNNG